METVVESYPITSQPRKRGRPPKLNKMGRPTLYRPEYGPMLLDYFKTNSSPISGEKDKKIAYSNFPTLEEFAVVKLNIGMSTFRGWRDKYPEFNSVCEQAQSIQKTILIKNGIVGIYNPMVMKFVAINCTDMRDEMTLNHAGNITVVMGLDRGVNVLPAATEIDITPKSQAIASYKIKTKATKTKRKANRSSK